MTYPQVLTVRAKPPQKRPGVVETNCDVSTSGDLTYTRHPIVNIVSTEKASPLLITVRIQFSYKRIFT